MIYEHTSYRNYLREVLSERVAKNPSYSLRSMASQLKVSPSTLSEVLKGKKNFSSERAMTVADRLGLAEADAEYFQLLVQMESTKSQKLKNSILQKIQQLNPDRQVHNLSVDMFKVIADWYHIPIMEMACLKSFNFTPQNIGRRLGISPLVVEHALARLLRLEMLTRDAKGRYCKTKGYVLISSAVPSESLNHFHRQMLQKAAESLETQTPKERFTGSETFAFSEEQLGAAKKMFEECFEKVKRLAQTGKNRNQVFHLGIQFFNLMKSKE